MHCGDGGWGFMRPEGWMFGIYCLVPQVDFAFAYYAVVNDVFSVRCVEPIVHKARRNLRDFTAVLYAKLSSKLNQSIAWRANIIYHVAARDRRGLVAWCTTNCWVFRFGERKNNELRRVNYNEDSVRTPMNSCRYIVVRISKHFLLNSGNSTTIGVNGGKMPR